MFRENIAYFEGTNLLIIFLEHYWKKFEKSTVKFRYLIDSNLVILEIQDRFNNYFWSISCKKNIR